MVCLNIDDSHTQNNHTNIIHDIVINASKTGQFEIIKHLVKSNTNIDFFRVSDNYLLYMACEHDRHDIVYLLLTKTKLNIKDVRSKNNRAFLAAVKNGNKRIVSLFVNFGLSRKDMEAENNLAIRYANIRGDREMVDHLSRFCYFM